MITVRPTQTADLTAVLAAEQHLDNAAFVAQWSRPRHQQAIDDPAEAHWSIEVQGHWIGYVLLEGLRNPHQSLGIRRIVITDKGKGYGRQTLRHVQKYAFEQQQAHRLWLDVKPNNARARALYQSVGFVEEGTLRDVTKTENGFESLIIMSQLVSEYTG